MHVKRTSICGPLRLNARAPSANRPLPFYDDDPHPILPGFNPDPSICRVGQDYPERLFSLSGKPGSLRLFGRESIGSWYDQSLVARRQEHFSFRAETELSFKPSTFQQAAGLVHYYNRHKFHFLAVTRDVAEGRVLSVLTCSGDWPDGKLSFPLAEPLPLPGDAPVRLAADVDGATLKFFVWGAEKWNLVGPVLDASVISDEGGRGEHGSFTGAFVGMAAFDTSGAALSADFGYFSNAGRDN
jgi:xylan 1,4-beta-xylosidase